MKKIIIAISMLLGMNVAFGGQMPAFQMNEMQIAQFNTLVNELVTANNVSEKEDYLFYGSITTLSLQCMTLAVLKILKTQGITHIPARLPRIGGVSLPLKHMLAFLSQTSIFMTAVIVHDSENKREFFPSQLPDKGVLCFVSASACAGLTLLCNLLHDEYVINAIKAQRNQPLILKSKIEFTQDFLADKTCGICMEKIEEPINCCENIDHLFCTKCLTEWFTTKEKPDTANPNSVFSCLLCTKIITKDNDKVAINRFFESEPNTKDFIRSLVGFDGVFLVLLTCNVCYLVFLTLS